MDKYTGFRELELADWRQFGHISIDFHSRLTILTGANASGKSTLLGILARHLNWNRQYSSAPVRSLKDRSSWSILGPRRMRRMRDSGSRWAQIGTLTYGNGGRTEISVPISDSNGRQEYDLYLPEQQVIQGVFLNSHRISNGNYISVAAIPTIFTDAEQMFERFTEEMRAAWAGSWTGRPPRMALKEALMAAALFGSPGNLSIDYNPEAAAIWDGFQEILSLVLPKSIRFKRLRVRVPDVIVETATGDFVLDDASGGVSAVLEMAWQIFLRSRNTDNFTVVLDEPENHLHPSLQRELLPSLLAAFPKAQFIVATHSPFVVTATPESYVYVLDFNIDGQVDSRALDYANKSSGADDTLRRVLGLPSTLPIWAEDKLSEIVTRHLQGSLTTESMDTLRVELAAIGLESDFPETVVRIVDSHREGQQ